MVLALEGKPLDRPFAAGLVVAVIYLISLSMYMYVHIYIYI